MRFRAADPRETCWECGRRETWREWWRMRRLRKKWAKRPPSDDLYTAQWVSDAILRELRPGWRTWGDHA